MNLNERIADLAAPAAAEAGLIVDEVRVHGAGKSTRVVITLDLPEDAVGSADMDAIATASRGIGAALDAADIIDASYLLEIGSPGVGRPLTERRHFMRARTRLLHIELAAGGMLTARLTEVDGDTLVLAVDGVKGRPATERRIGIDDVKAARVEPELKRLAELGPVDDTDDEAADDEEGEA